MRVYSFMPSTQVTAIEKTDAGYVCQLDNGQTVTGDVHTLLSRSLALEMTVTLVSRLLISDYEWLVNRW
jgi:hypothetical protein